MLHYDHEWSYSTHLNYVPTITLGTMYQSQTTDTLEPIYHISMCDHMYSRGYARNVQGARMSQR
jgi:hypothetical protein